MTVIGLSLWSCGGIGVVCGLVRYVVCSSEIDVFLGLSLFIEFIRSR